MNRRMILASLAAAVICGTLPVTVRAADGAKIPVFLMCPHQKRYSAWSVYVVADPSTPGKIAKLGLDKLKGQNSEDNAGGFAGVWKAQSDAATTVEDLGTLDASEFGKGKIEIQKDDALKLSIEPAQDGSYRLMISMRCTSDKRFDVGGKFTKTRDFVVKYDKAANTFYTQAVQVKSINDEALISPPGAPILGIDFPVTGTGIYRIIGVMKDDQQVLLIDGWRKESQ